MKKNETEIEKVVDHPLEDIFNIESGSTVVVEHEITTELEEHPGYDGKDLEIEQQLQEIHDVAMTAFENQQKAMGGIDPRFVARNQEVSVQYLNAALNAIKEKSNMKKTKDKISTESSGHSTVNNNLIIDRNDLMKYMLEQSDDEKESEDE